MYAQKMVSTIKVTGRSLREIDDSVYLPFGSEYSIYLKNLNTVRASVKVEIDGQDVTQGVALVLEPNNVFELERFIKNGNLDRGNRFKFIEKTAAVVAHRGSRAEDGLVRVTYQFEKVQPIYVNSNHITSGFLRGSPIYGATASNATLKGSSYDPNSTQEDYFLRQSAGGGSQAQNLAGITAPGSVSEQQFTTVAPLTLESQKHVIVIRLVGELDGGKQVTKASTTRTTTTCETCGHKTRSATAKFCSNCGASLQLVD